MTTQHGLIIEKPGAPFKVVDSLERPTPGRKQALVKSLFVAINPVEEYMSKTGAITTEIPAVLGSDFCGLVVQDGPGCNKLQTGDYVFGLCRLGRNQFSPFQETFLVDEDLVFRKDGRIEPEAAAGVGLGVLTSALGIVVGGKKPLPHHGTKIAEHDEWIVVLGGSGSVGHYAVQIARLCGYKVAASCSPTKSESVLQRGANATFNNRSPVTEQAAEINAITDGHFSLIFDTSALCHGLAREAFKHSTAAEKYFSTTDTVTEFQTGSDVKEYRVITSLLGREDVRSRHVTAEVAKMMALLEAHIADGTITPVEYELHAGFGWEVLAKAIAQYEAGKVDKKLVVRVQEG